MGPRDTADGVGALSLYLLDTTVLIAHLRGDGAVTKLLLDLLGQGHSLGTSCVNVAGGTARAHGAIVLTDNVRDFPMRDIRVESGASS